MSDFQKRMFGFFGFAAMAAILAGLMIATKDASRTQVDCECTCRASECVAFRKPGDLPRCSSCRCK